MTVWFVAAVAVLIIELLTGTVYLLVVSAALAGSGIAYGLTGSTPAAVLTAALLSALGIWFVHAKTAVRKVETDSYQDLDAGQYVEILRHTGGNRYEVFYRGTHWQAQNTRLGRFHRALTAGLNILIPFIDRVAYRHSLKEIPLDVPSQVCITRDNTQLTVDGIIYFQVTDPKLASYGSSNYIMAITQLAQTTLRSVIGRMELDKTFEERDEINSTVVAALDEAAGAWGVKVLRYEIKDLVPPQEILRSMQAQITAEREKRARIAESEGRKIEQINLASGQREAEIQQSEGEAQAAVNASNAEKIARINRAKGEAESLRLVAEANAEAIRQIAAALQTQGGADAVNLKIAEQYVAAFNNLAKESNTLIMPANVADIGSLISAGMKIIDSSKTAK
ncbi:paraslipin [Neisseria meningitidis]|nr:paraslipin [Neisseria meningitidis]MBG8823105.1 paraslipin [Neisseria meningitidis]MBG8838393.1 paraslipin [Neisseria meningitidis]MBG8848893.1 paraslipin [Neisseria meningitidis]MBJ1832289.1 paraslipin [Neisseria meningitidis]